jgi:twitching motility protein PilT
VQDTISRIVDVFPPEQQAQVQTQLAATLQAVLCQTLVKRRDGGGRVSAAEIMICDDGVRNQIRKGQLHQIQSTLETSAAKGMQTLVKHLAQLTMSGVITFEAGWEKAPNRSEFEATTGGEAAVARRVAAASGSVSNDYRGSM